MILVEQRKCIRWKDSSGVQGIECSGEAISVIDRGRELKEIGLVTGFL